MRFRPPLLPFPPSSPSGRQGADPLRPERKPADEQRGRPRLGAAAAGVCAAIGSNIGFLFRRARVVPALNSSWSLTMQQPVSVSALRGTIAILALFALGGCASGAKIRSDHDKAADFSRYHTYNFIEGAGPDTGDYDSLFTQYMIAAIDIEMQKRGYTKSDHPDLLVNFNAVLRDKTKVTQSPTPMYGGYYGYRGGFYDPWGGYGYATQTNVSQYTEGTFNIDLVDAKEKRLVWEAVGVGRITDKLLQNLQQAVMQGVPKFFANYPFVAGSGMPAQAEK